MMPETIILVAIISLVLFSVVVGFLVGWKMDAAGNINMMGGKLANSDASIKDAMPYLKITNVWSE